MLETNPRLFKNVKQLWDQNFFEHHLIQHIFIYLHKFLVLPSKNQVQKMLMFNFISIFEFEFALECFQNN
jgi:hypothetical protein